MIETLAANGADQALDVGILPGSGWCREDFSDAHRGDPTPEQITIDRIAIPQEPGRGGLIGEGLNDLLGRPGGGGMLGDPEMDDTPTVMRQQDQHEQHAVR